MTRIVSQRSEARPGGEGEGGGGGGGREGGGRGRRREEGGFSRAVEYLYFYRRSTITLPLFYYCPTRRA